VKTPRDLQLQLAKVIVHTDKHMVDNLYSASFGHTLIVAIAMDRKSSAFLPQRLADEGGRLLHDWCLENGMLEEDADVFVSETVAHWAEMAEAADKSDGARKKKAEKVEQSSSSAAIRMRAAILRTSAVIAAQGGDLKGRMVSMNEFSEETQAVIDLVYTHLKELA